MEDWCKEDVGKEGKKSCKTDWSEKKEVKRKLGGMRKGEVSQAG